MPRSTALRAVIGIAAVAGAVYGMAQIPNPSDLLGACMGFVILVALLVSWLLPVVDQWTRLLGIAGGQMYAHGGSSARHRFCRGCLAAA